MELTSTSYVILGFLAGGVGSGYDIKALADKSVRFFWNLSYGQIYPELKRLADAGLAKATSDPNGSRKRTTYQLTPPGARRFAIGSRRVRSVRSRCATRCS